MKPVSPMICVIAIALSLAGSVASAQGCAGSSYTATITCQNPHTGCPSTTVTQTIPNFGQYGVTWVSAPVICCGQIYASYAFQGWSCGDSDKILDPAIRRRLLELAESQDIMVNSCKGEFRPPDIALMEKPGTSPAAPPGPLRMRRALPGVVGGRE